MTETPDSIKSKIDCGTYTVTQKPTGRSVLGTVYFPLFGKAKVLCKGGYFAELAKKCLPHQICHGINVA